MESPAAAVRKPRKTAKRPASDASEERRKQQRHAEQVATLGEEDERVRRLEELLFGGEERLTGRLQEDGGVAEDEGEACGVPSEEESDAPQTRRSAAWEDEEDALDDEVDMTHRFRRDLQRSDAEAKMTQRRLQQRLKEQFQRAMGGTPSWAEDAGAARRTSDSEDEDEDLLRRTGNFVGSSDGLPSGVIKMKKCLNANHARPSAGPLSSVQFHPSAQIVMTAGLDHAVSLFQVDGKTNPKIQSVHLEKFPVSKASFSADGQHIVATGKRSKLFYIYDMMEGRVEPVTGVRGLQEQKVSDFEVSPDGKYLLLSGSSGFLHLMTTKTREVVRSMKLNGSVCAAAFTADGGSVFSSSQEGEVFIWDVRSSKCVKKFADDGCVRSTSLCLSRDGSYLACGSQSGVVNVYSQKDCLHAAEPKPLKAVMNLVTAATCLRFNSSAEILAIGSDADHEANRLVHLPSFTVFSNFPQFRKRTIFRSQCVDFSPRGGFYSVANDRGEALLFRLLHYNDF